MAEAKDVLESMGISLEDAIRINEEEKEKIRSRRDGRICMCGHSIKQHLDLGNGDFSCSTARMNCRCRSREVALVADDIRMFLFRTNGPSAQHALIRGIALSAQKGKGVQWVAKLVCNICESDDGRKVVPVPASRDGRLLREGDGQRNFLVCDECRAKF